MQVRTKQKPIGDLALAEARPRIGSPYLGSETTAGRTGVGLSVSATSRQACQTRCPSPDAKSYFLSVCVRIFQSAGCLTHDSCGKKTGWTSSVHPIWSAVLPSLKRIRSRIAPRRDSISARVAQPFACSKVSHANQIGSAEYRANHAKPQMALLGALNLNRNGENSGARNARVADGRQKLTSVRSGRTRRNWYQPVSVTATVPIRGSYSASVD